MKTSIIYNVISDDTLMLSTLDHKEAKELAQALSKQNHTSTEIEVEERVAVDHTRNM